MIQINDDLLALLSQATYSLSGVTAKDAYSITKVSPPQLTLLEIPSNNGVYLHGDPKIVQNTFQLEAYSRQSTSPKMSASDAAMLLLIEADIILTPYGLTMIGTPTRMPYDADTTISRSIARYMCYIDTRDDMNRIYRNI